MKTSQFKQLSGLLAACVLPMASIHAHEGDEHGHHSHAPQAANAQEAWTNAQSAFKAMQAAAAAKQHDQIHTEQEKLAASLKQLQEKSTGGDKARLEGAIKNAISASEKVHVAADAKDAAKVDSGMKTLEATMSMVEKQVAAPAK